MVGGKILKIEINRPHTWSDNMKMRLEGPYINSLWEGIL